jgi:hypothetical protein
LNEAANRYEGTEHVLTKEAAALAAAAAVGATVTYANAPSVGIGKPNLNGAAYDEYRSGSYYKGKLYRYQCVGYAKGRVAERYGISFGEPWVDGEQSASNIAKNYGGQVINGYRIDYCTSDNIQPGSIASFNGTSDNSAGHVVFVEDVWTDQNGVTMVKFSEANWDGKGDGGGTDSLFQTMTIDEFRKGRDGGSLKDLIHFVKV